MERSEDEPLAAVDSIDIGRNKGFKLKYAIEFPVMLLMIGSTMSGAPISNLIMYRTCVHPLGHSVEECRSFLEPAAINHTQQLEEEVQEYTTVVSTVKAVMEGIGPAVLALFIGVWSDKHGRKPLLTVPIFGMMVGSMLTVVYSLLEDLGPWWIIGIAIPVTMTGSFTVMVTGMVCYISDITSQKNRSLRLVLIQVTIAIASTTGSMASSYVLEAIGTVYLLLLVATLQTISTVYMLLIVVESMQNATPGSVSTIFNISHAKEMIRACFERKPNYGRAIILLCIGASCLSVFTVYGSHTLLYMFVRNRIQWTMKDFTMFSAISDAMWFSGSLFGVAVIQKLTGISDLSFIAISFLSCIVEYTLKTLATTKWLMYLSSAISLFGTISGPLIRSVLTKTIPSEDTAKVFGFHCAAEASLPLLSPVVYNALYAATISDFPQSIMVLTTLINVVCFTMALIVIYLKKKTTAAVPYQSIATTEET